MARRSSATWTVRLRSSTTWLGQTASRSSDRGDHLPFGISKGREDRGATAANRDGSALPLQGQTSPVKGEGAEADERESDPWHGPHPGSDPGGGWRAPPPE